MTSPLSLNFRRSIAATLCLLACLMFSITAQAQYSEVTGEVFGVVTGPDDKPIKDAKVTIKNEEIGLQRIQTTDAAGNFRQGSLPSGTYTITATASGFGPPLENGTARVFVMKPNESRPVPIKLSSLGADKTETTPQPPGDPKQPDPQPKQPETPTGTVAKTPSQTDPGGQDAKKGGDIVVAPFSDSDARRGGQYSSEEVSTLPLGSTTLTRTFDELALLLPGVALPPQTIGNGSGPGQGAGVGSAGQFAVNGLRSRANNFTVDGSDNNDEDIGVRRQGFFSLVPQPIESIEEYQVTTLLAPAQFGRNFGAQVNAVSKRGTNEFHGTVYGFLNSSQLNARNAFDTANGNATTNVTATTRFGGQTFVQPVLLDGAPLRVTNQSGGEDSFTLGQGGFVLGGPIKQNKAFFFVSYERQVLNASREASFAVPTVEQRGIFGTGATGIFADCLTPFNSGFNITNCTPDNSVNFFPEFGFPTSAEGDAIFSLFPFPNNPGGVYGVNTFTEILPANARGNVASAKYDQNFNLWGQPQTFTARYNFTQDWRDIPVTGAALFSTLRPRVRTQNFSTFLNSVITNNMSNVLRLSYGRTRLVFDEVRNPFLRPSEESPNVPFLLNAPLLVNLTINPDPVPNPINPTGFVGIPNTGPVFYSTSGTAESLLGRVGQVNIAGFSPIGVDVNNFPQSRVNNTYQIADVLGYQTGKHSLAFGADIRRVELNSDLPRNSRTLLTFNGAPEFDNDPNSQNIFTGNFVSGLDLAAASAPSGAFLSLARTGSGIGLRYYELNGFVQDTWRIRSNLSLNFGLRYEYNTPPRENNRLIEGTFNDPALNDPNVTDLRLFISGRSRIFEPDRNNFAPRVGIAFSPDLFGRDRSTIIRAGFGVFYDQILGAVVSQSRNVFPNFVTINTGGFDQDNSGFIGYFNPAVGGLCLNGDCVNQFVPLVRPGTLNTFNPNLTLAQVVGIFGNSFPNPFSATLPARELVTPSAEHFSVTFEQQLNSNMLVSAAYIGTRGHNLLRTSTPNLGPNNVLLPFAVFAGFDLGGLIVPNLLGFSTAPGTAGTGFDRPRPAIGPVTIYETAGGSSYDALQLQMRGRFTTGLQFQAAYTLSKAEDDTSDVFDLAGAPALPQDSATRDGELGPSSFDARHRFSYNFIYDFPINSGDSGLYRAIFKGLQIASTGYFQTGQPFTVNSIFDVNLDGNLTDRLNTTQGIIVTGDRRQPIAVAAGTNRATLIATPGENGIIGRNSFRAGNVLNLDLSVVKNFEIREGQRITLRMDVFNFINRANYGIPVRFLEAPGFGQATDTVTPGRRIQFALKFSF